jgi:hypothetical protein
VIEPQIVTTFDAGYHNKDLALSVKRLEKSAAYKDLSTIIVIPALGTLPTKVAASFMNLYSPPNQKRVVLWALGQEVGEAYSRCIEMILEHPELSQFKYVLTMEHDNLPPPDGHLRLLQTAEAHPEYDCIGGLYWTKGEGGQPQIWGNPKEPLNFKPIPPDPKGGLVECVGTGMGFNLFRLEMFKDKKLRKPWFKTQADSGGVATQDLYFWGDAFKHGHKAAIDCSVRVGHYDYEGKFGQPDTIW